MNIMLFNELVQISMLVEGISISPVSYGTNAPDFDNELVDKMASGISASFIIHEGMIYLIQSSDSSGEVAFGVSLTIPSNNDELLSTVFTDRQTNSSNVINIIRLFGHIMYVILEINKNKNVIYFKPANDKLGNFYKLLTKDKNFNNHLNNLGYSNLYYQDKKYKFKKS